jgi:hypothetical protein
MQREPHRYRLCKRPTTMIDPRPWVITTTNDSRVQSFWHWHTAMCFLTGQAP